MLTRQPLPHDLDAQVKSTLAKDEQVLLHLNSDIAKDLRFGERWLILTNKRVLVHPAADGGNGSRFLSFALNTITAAEIQPIVGGGILLVRTKKATHPLMHFSNSRTAHFAEAAKGIQQLAKGKPLELSADVPAERCAKCGRLKPDPRENCPFCVKYIEVIMRILKFLKPHAWRTVVAVTLTAGTTGLMLVPPLLTKRIIDDVFPSKNLELLGWLVLMFLVINILTAVLSVFTGVLLSWLGGRVSSDIRAQVFQAVERLSMKFFDRRHTGHIMARIMNDTNRLQAFLIEGFPFLAQAILLAVGIPGVLYFHSPLLTFLIMIPVPIMFFSQYLFWKVVRHLDHKAMNQYSLLTSRLHESLSGVRVVKSFSQEPQEMDRFNKQNSRLFTSQFIVDRVWSMFHPGMNFFVTSGFLIVWYFGGRKVIGETMSLGTIMMFISYLWLFYGPLQFFNAIVNWMTRAFAGAERIFETMDQTPETYDQPDAKACPTFKGAVEFRNVTFSYEKGKPALNNVSFKVRAGEVIGLVGRSGSGKSTLLSLMCRFYEPDEGEILVDGIPINRIRLEDLRRNIGLVFQESFLFGNSIFENISYSRPDAVSDQVIAAARAANAHEFIMQKPDAYDTRVGERGNRLSGGEKQRLSIARAILHNPDILVLDEATSSVDSETEMKIQQALERLVQNRTTFIAAHRLSTLRHADRIIVLDQGKIQETGSHDELMRKRGTYYKFIHVQEKAWRRGKKHLSVTGEKVGANGSSGK